MSEDHFTAAEEAQFDAAAAEAGYSAEYLRTRRQVGGRPRELGDQAGEVVQFRLDPARIAALDRRAAQRNSTRSDVIRQAIDRELAAA
jgi:hypothetical protein